MDLDGNLGLCLPCGGFPLLTQPPNFTKYKQRGGSLQVWNICAHSSHGLPTSLNTSRRVGHCRRGMSVQEKAGPVTIHALFLRIKEGSVEKEFQELECSL